MSVIKDLDQRPGRCAFCDDPLPPPKTKPATVCCGLPECKKSYQKAAYIHRVQDYRLRDVEWMGDGYARLTCGHWVVAKTWIEKRRLRRRCPTCPRFNAPLERQRNASL